MSRSPLYPVEECLGIAVDHRLRTLETDTQECRSNMRNSSVDLAGRAHTKQYLKMREIKQLNEAVLHRRDINHNAVLLSNLQDPGYEIGPLKIHSYTEKWSCTG